nr:oligosaccharide flippase family protein [Marinobacter oulmenensis]
MFKNYKSVIYWSLANQAITMFAGFLSVSLINRLFGKETYGEMVFFQSIFAYIAILATLGFDKTILFKLSSHSESKTKLYGKSLLAFTHKYSFLAVALAELVFIACWHLFVHKELDNEWFWISLFSVNTFGVVATTMYGAFFQANKFSDTTIKIQLTNSGLKILILLSLFVLNKDSIAYFFSYIIIPTALSLVQYFIVHTRVSGPTGEEPSKATRDDVIYAIKLMFTKVLHQGLEKLDLIMVGAFLSTAFVAEYAVAAKLAFVISLGNNLLSPLLAPRLKYALSNKETTEIVKEYNYNKFFSSTIAIFILSIFLIFGEQILSMFGDYRESYPLLLILGLAFLNQNAFGPNGRFLMLQGHASFTLLSTIASLALMVLLNIIFIPKLGVLGAALGTLISVLILNITLQAYIIKKENIKFTGSAYYFVCALINLSILGVAFE